MDDVANPPGTARGCSSARCLKGTDDVPYLSTKHGGVHNLTVSVLMTLWKEPTIFCVFNSAHQRDGLCLIISVQSGLRTGLTTFRALRVRQRTGHHLGVSVPCGLGKYY